MTKRIGVIGAGAMGAGIAQVAATAGLSVVLYDIGEAPLGAGLERIRSGMDRLVQRGKMVGEARDGALARVATTTSLADLAGTDFVVEAAPEILDLKRKLFAELDRVCGPEAILATNTSSLSVTEIAAATERPDRVVGMHFFNPVPLMQLVEVVSGSRTGAGSAAATADLARLLGKTPVMAKDTPGFIVNRIARPFPGEALRLVGENVASARQIDRVVRLAAGFRMGPFELMDLVGMDINFAVNRSVFEQFFYEPRFRPHPLQAQMVKANLLGRKTGEGWYRYLGTAIVDGPAGPEFAGQPSPKVPGPVYVEGDQAMADLALEAGYDLTPDPEAARVVILGNADFTVPVQSDALVLVEASSASVTGVGARHDRPERVAGYGGLPSVRERRLMEVAAGLRTADETLREAEAFFHSLGRDTEVMRDTPGLIAPRLIACLANEAAYALMEGVASAADIDSAMRLGVNYPMGPLEWADALGVNHVLRILRHMHHVTGDDRYRPCPYLRQVVAAGLPLGAR